MIEVKKEKEKLITAGSMNRYLWQWLWGKTLCFQDRDPSALPACKPRPHPSIIPFFAVELGQGKFTKSRADGEDKNKNIQPIWKYICL